MTLGLGLRDTALRPKPQGFDGRLGIAVTDEAPDSTPMQLKHEAGVRVDLNIACMAESA